MMSSKAKYAVRAAVMLARDEAAEGWTATSDVAERENIPRKFLEAILVELRDAGLVESRRGPSGGHRLGRPASGISVADVLRCIDGPLALTPCASRTRFGPCKDCEAMAACPLKGVMQQARDAVAAVLENCSLRSLALSHPGARRRKPGPARAQAAKQGIFPT
jgi:Rrf2 family protein